MAPDHKRARVTAADGATALKDARKGDEVKATAAAGAAAPTGAKKVEEVAATAAAGADAKEAAHEPASSMAAAHDPFEYRYFDWRTEAELVRMYPNRWVCDLIKHAATNVVTIIDDEREVTQWYVVVGFRMTDRWGGYNEAEG